MIVEILMLPLCPCCGAKITTPVEVCRRCDCNLLLLCKIRNEATRLASEEKFFQANSLASSSPAR